MPYATDISEEKYNLVSDIFDIGNYGSTRKYPILNLLNALFYLGKTGCQWHMLPMDFLPYKTVNSF